MPSRFRFAARLRHHLLPRLLLGLALLPAALHSQPRRESAPPPPPLILISIDGFRHDYLALHADHCPTLRRLAAGGVRAQGLVPVFPTLTFPNHYSIVTGCYPQRHGIIGNTIFDPATGDTFRIRDRAAVADSRWWGAEPIWVTAVKQGLRSGTVFWPGSEARIAGHRPTYWLPYDGRLPNTARVDTLLAWLDLPAARRPHVLTLYFSDVDSKGHTYGTTAPQTAAAIAHVDSALAYLLAGLAQRGLADAVNLVVVSDHGMTDIRPDRYVPLDHYVPKDWLRMANTYVVSLLYPLPGMTARVLDTLRRNPPPHLRAYARRNIPRRLHFRRNPRIGEVLLLADEGWQMGYAGFRPGSGATHGYDNAYPSMQGICIASGPGFAHDGRTLPPFENIHLYPLMCRLLGLRPAPCDGRAARLRALRR